MQLRVQVHVLHTSGEKTMLILSVTCGHLPNITRLCPKYRLLNALFNVFGE